MTCRILPCAALLVLAGCDIDEALAHSQKYTEDFHFVHALKPGARVWVEGFNGSVEIYGWDQEQVEINGTKYASSKDDLAEIKIDIAHTPDSVTIKTLRPDWQNGSSGMRRGNRGVKYRIHVPRRVQLERLATSNGAIRVDGVEGRGRFRTSNGPISLTAYKGDIEAQTSNGRIDLDRFSGSAVLISSNGSIEAKGIKGFLEATTSNGPIEVETAELDPARVVKLESSNGPITLTLGAPGGPDVRARTSNGDIAVRLAEGAGARVRAHTSNSTITSDLPLNNVTNIGKAKLEGSVGKGGPLLDLVTSNGHIRLARK